MAGSLRVCCKVVGGYPRYKSPLCLGHFGNTLGFVPNGDIAGPSNSGRAAEEAPDAIAFGVDDDAALLDRNIPDFDWARLPVGMTRTWFDAPSGRLAAVVQGDPEGQRVLLVPGATGSKEDFLLMMPLLAAAGYRVESYDLAGQYESAQAGPENLDPPRRRYDYELFVDDLIAVLEAGDTPAHVLGYSFAAVVAQLASVQRPELFASLAMMSPSPEAGQSFRGMKRVGWLSGVGPDWWGASLMIWGIRLNVIRVPPGRLRFATRRFSLTRRSSVNDIIGLMRNAPDLRKPLAKTEFPKLVAVGEHDLWPIALHRRFARSINAALAVYRAGHSPCETSPHQLSRDLLVLYGQASEP